MSISRAPLRRFSSLLLVFGLALVAACNGDNYPQSALHPKGDFAEQVDHVFRLTVWWATGIFIVVEAALLWAVFRFRGKPDDPEPEQSHGNTTLEIIWTIIPAAVLAFVAVPTVRTIFATAEVPHTSPDGSKPLLVEVVGHQWWWEFRYPEYGITTANQMHIPVGRTVDVRMKTKDVLHSFWVPQFAGKRDVFPNRETRIWFTAKEAGAYPGACAEFCGLQHGRMLFYTVAQSSEEFDQWVATRTADSARYTPPDMTAPVDSLAAVAGVSPQVIEGQRLFLTKTCAACHTFQAINPPPTTGPNLSGIGTRLKIAAGWLDNTDENLAHWIRAPLELKEVTLIVVPMEVTEAEAQALVAYLRTKR